MQRTQSIIYPKEFIGKSLGLGSPKESVSNLTAKYIIKDITVTGIQNTQSNLNITGMNIIYPLPQCGHI